MEIGLKSTESCCRMEKRIKRTAVWTSKKPPYEIGKDGFGMKDLVKDYDGWVDAKTYRPYPYDLVHMMMPRKTIRGWWTGQKWEGLRLKEEDKILHWKQWEVYEENK
jgi:hypothetical protein